MSQVLSFMLNGRPVSVDVDAQAMLLDILRGPLAVTGAKANCLEAECGVCTVLVDGAAIASCITPAFQCAGRSVTTIEGLADDPLLPAFVEHGAVQCGFCTPGMIVTARGFLDGFGAGLPDESAIRRGLSGTLCRCTGYQKIVDAVADVAARERGG